MSARPDGAQQVFRGHQNDNWYVFLQCVVTVIVPAHNKHILYVHTPGVDMGILTLQIDGKVIKSQIWDTAGQVRADQHTH